MTPAVDPLNGLRVLELSTEPSSPSLMGRLFAEFGADVVMVEPSEGNRARRACADGAEEKYTFHLIAGRKRSVTIDPHNEDDWGRLTRAITRCDVLLLDRVWYETLRSHGLDSHGIEIIAPHVVSCCVSPFGLYGPLADIPATEIIVQAMAGMMTSNGNESDPPLSSGVPVAMLMGALLGMVATLAALFERTRCGRGQFVDQSQYDSLVALYGTLLPTYFLTGESPSRIGNWHMMSAPWNSYQTCDGWLLFCTMSDVQWRRFAELIERPELASDDLFETSQRRIENVEELDEIVSCWTRSYTTVEALQLLQDADLPAGPILTPIEVFGDPHALARGFRKDKYGGLERMSPLPSTKTDPALPPDLGSDEEPWNTASIWFAIDSRAGSVSGEGALSGLRIVELGLLTAGPLLTRYLSMLGAEVIKVEPPRGEACRHVAQRVLNDSYLYHMNNTDKRDVVLDLTDHADREKFYKIVETADVFVSNLSSKTLGSLGLSYEILRHHRDDLIYCSLSGFGLTGPYSNRKAFDTVIQGMSGIMSLTGTESGMPTKVGVSIADLFGAAVGAIGVLVGVLSREVRSGGGLVDASLYDASVWSTWPSWPRFLANGSLARNGNRHPTFTPHNTFETEDGTVVIAVERDEQWIGLVTAMSKPELTHQSGLRTAAMRASRHVQVERIVSEWTLGHSAEYVLRSCLENGVPVAIPATLREVAEGAHTRARGMIVHVKAGTGEEIAVIGSPFKLSRTPATVRRIAPSLGEDNESFLDM